ncbi:MAG: acetyl-CoA carboxylase biotin carboxyl carrier protein [Alphaproteobacteria bacterium]
MAAEEKQTKRLDPTDESLIRGLAALLDETGLTEIELEQQGARIRITRNVVVAAAAQVAQAAPAANSGAAPGGAEAGSNAAVSADSPGALKSPMVGTAYSAPEPGAPAFVEVGATVQKGQTVMIIEAMKTMNHIPAPKAGTVKAILVENGQPVEFGEPLMIIE